MIIISFTPFMMRPVLLAQFKTVSTSIIQTRVYFPTLLNTHLVTHPAPVPCTPHTSSFSPPMYAKGCQRQTYTAERIKNKYRREMKDDTWTDFFSILRELVTVQAWAGTSVPSNPPGQWLPLGERWGLQCWTVIEQSLGWAAVTEGASLTVQKKETSALFRTRDSWTTDNFLIPQSVWLWTWEESNSHQGVVCEMHTLAVLVPGD